MTNMNTGSNWRNISYLTIQKVLADNPGKSQAELKKLISAAYPFGERKMWPYKVWLEEVHAALHDRRQPLPKRQSELFRE